MLLASITDRSVSPGSTIRTLIPSKDADYALLVTDRGAVSIAAGITFTLPPFFQPFLGESVFIVNLSTGDIMVEPANGEFIKTVSGSKIQDVVPAASSRSYLRETDSMKWIATGAAAALSEQMIEALINQAVDAKVASGETVTVKGDTGERGPSGTDGKSAYQLAVDDGFSGSQYDYLVSLMGAKGDTGSQGPVGPTGSVGSTGATGLKGDVGAQGSTGAQGPKGDKGDKGDIGETGPQGVIGLTGAKGTTGDTGATGPVGSAGSQGATGLTGATGAAGSNGSVGATGPAGPQGTQGIKGDTGSVGATGSTGAVGSTGSQGVKGDTGNTGSQGTQGIKGDAGATGAQGAKGDVGATGLQGPIGLTGATGATGITGPQGTTGSTGASGSNASATPLGSAAPQALGTAAAGSSANASREDHVHAKPAGLLALIGSGVATETLLVSLSLGVKRLSVTVSGVLSTDKLVAIPNGNPTTGCELLNVYPTAANTVSVGLFVPALGIGATYSVPFSLYRIS